MKYFETIDEETEEKIWNRYGKTIETVNKDVDDLKVWLQSQPHLPQIFNTRQLKNILLMSKTDIDRCKAKLGNYLRISILFPEIYLDGNPFGGRMLEVSKYVYHVTLPKLCPDLSRILIIKPKEHNDPIDMYAAYCHLLNALDIRLLEDAAEGTTYIFDAEYCKMGYISKLTPMYFKTMHLLQDKIIPSKVVAIYILNAPSCVDHILSVVKKIIKPKLLNRITIHKDANSILKYVPKDIMPKDYGGNEKSMDELEELFNKKFEEYKDFFDQRDQLKVTEDLRPSLNESDEFFGYYGSFRKLEVD